MTFEGFAKALSVMSPAASLEEKIALSFRLYDTDGDGQLSTRDVHEVLRECISCSGRFIRMSQEQCAEVVSQTFSELCVPPGAALSKVGVYLPFLLL